MTSFVFAISIVLLWSLEIANIKHVFWRWYQSGLPCAATVPYTFIGEILPPKHRDLLLSTANSIQITGIAMVPLLSWGILPLDFKIDFGIYYFRPWRLLAMMCSVGFIISAFFMSFGPESPKYLISQGRHDESLEVLKKIYSGNTGKTPDNYPVKCLKKPEENNQRDPFFKSIKVQSVPLLKQPYMKWMILNGIILFGIYATVNGFAMWVPDILNRVITGNTKGLTVCGIIRHKLNETIVLNHGCDDSIDTTTFKIIAIANTLCTAIALILSGSVKVIGKKFLLIVLLLAIGSFIVLINFVTQKMLFTVLISTIPVTAHGIGSVNTYAVEIFPTKLRGMAVSLTMMAGRLGSVFSAVMAGISLNAACEYTFYVCGGYLLMCAALSFCYQNTKEKREQDITHL